MKIGAEQRKKNIVKQENSVKFNGDETTKTSTITTKTTTTLTTTRNNANNKEIDIK